MPRANAAVCVALYIRRLITISGSQYPNRYLQHAGIPQSLLLQWATQYVNEGSPHMMD